MKTAIVLAGGKGTRLGDVLPPKAMLKINGNTLLDLQLEWLEREGFQNVILCLGHRHDEVSFKKRSINVVVSIEGSPLGTGGAVKNAFSQYYDLCQDGVYVLNVDDLAPVDTSSVVVLKKSSIVSKPVPFSVWVEQKMHPQNSALQHIGHTFLSFDDLTELPKGSFSLEQQLSSWSSRIGFFVHNGSWVTVNSNEQLEKAQKNL